jgi:hypothetical protein
MSFSSITTDSQYTYTAPTDAEVIKEWKIRNNNKVSDTQGFLVKVEKGQTRVELIMSIADTKANLDTYLLPQLTYPSNVTLTLNRNIPSKSTNTGTFAVVDYVLVNEFNDGTEQEVEVKYVEVLS